MPGPLAGGRGELTSSDDRHRAIELLKEGTREGASVAGIADILGVCPRTLRRWREEHHQRGHSMDGRKGAPRHVGRKLTEKEKEQIIETVNQERFAHLPPAQIVAILAEEGIYIASEASFYRVMHSAALIQHRGQCKPPQEPRKVPILEASGPNMVWSWDITLLPSHVKGMWYYLYMIIDVWSRKIIAFEIHGEECGEAAAQILDRACREHGISSSSLLILHSDNGAPMRSMTLAAKLDDLGVGQSFSRPRVSNDNPYSEALFRTLKYHQSYPNRPFPSEDIARQWVNEFVAFYNNEHRHSGIKYVTPNQRHIGKADEICSTRTKTYQKAYDLHPSRWSRQIRCWDQPVVVRINQPIRTELKQQKS